MRIKLFPLAAPVGTNLFFPDYSPAFRCLGPTDALAHKRQSTIDVPLVESSVDLGYEPLCVCHTILRVDDPLACMTMIGPDKRACTARAGVPSAATVAVAIPTYRYESPERSPTHFNPHRRKDP